MRSESDLPLIKVVGTSGSGKSTLVRNLREAGYNARPVSQEHSNIPDLWQHFQPPWVLIYLYADLATIMRRRPDAMWNAEVHRQECQRLAHARDHADIRIATTDLDPLEVAKIARIYLEKVRTLHLDHPLAPVPATGSARSQD